MKARWDGWSKTQRIQVLSGSFILLSFLVFIALMLSSHGGIAGQVLFSDMNDTFMDFYNSVYDAADGAPYSHGVIYPPLCNIVYWLCSKMIPYSYLFGQPYSFPGGSFIRNVQGAHIAFGIYSVVLGFILIYVILKMWRGYNEHFRLFVLAVVFASTPVLFALERGNIILYAWAFLLVYYVCYSSDNKIIRETGYIALAFSAAIKVYPALFGLMLIADKRYYAALRTILYGAFLFFFPFIFFGGFPAIGQLFQNMTSFVGGGGSGISFAGTLNLLVYGTGHDFPHAELISIIFSVIILAAAFFEKSSWKRSCLLTCAMIGVISNNGKYSGIFLIIPWLLFFLETKEWRKLDYVYAGIFTFLFAPIPLGFFADGKTSNNSVLMAFLILILSLVVTADSFIGTISRWRKKKALTEKKNGANVTAQ